MLPGMKKVIRTDRIDFQYENDVEICGKEYGVLSLRSFICLCSSPFHGVRNRDNTGVKEINSHGDKETSR